MAKAEALNPGDLMVAVPTPKAATSPRLPAGVSDQVIDDVARQLEEAEAAALKGGGSKKVPLQIRATPEEAKSIRVLAAQNDLSISDFVLMCVGEWKQRNKTA